MNVWDRRNWKKHIQDKEIGKDSGRPFEGVRLEG